MPGLIDVGAGVIDKDNPYVFNVGLFEAIEEVIRQYNGFTDVPLLSQSDIPKGINLTIKEINDLIYDRVKSNIKRMQKGGASINLGELRRVKAYIAKPINPWTLIVEDGLGNYELKVLLAPEMNDKAPIKNINFMLEGLVNLIPKGESIINTSIWDGEIAMKNNKVIYLHRSTNVINIINGRVHTFKDGLLIKKQSIKELIKEVLKNRKLVMKDDFEYLGHVATPKTEVFYKDGVSKQLFNKKSVGVIKTPLSSLSVHG